MILTQRDVDICNYLHQNKVASTRQIHRDIFVKNYTNLRNRLRAFEKKDLIQRVYAKAPLDKSRHYSLAAKGMKVVEANLNGIVDFKRFKSDSVDHDLRLVEIRKKLSGRKMVKEYFTENQIQTYVDFQNLEHLVTFKRLYVDALVALEDDVGEKIYVPVEYEAHTKSVTWYQRRMGKLYFYPTIPIILYICATPQIEKKIKEVESVYAKDRDKKIFYITLDEFTKSADFVTFRSQESKFIKIN